MRICGVAVQVVPEAVCSGRSGSCILRPGVQLFAQTARHCAAQPAVRRASESAVQSAVRSATSCVCSFARSCRVPARPVVLTRGFCHLWFLNEIFRCWQRQNFQKGLRQATAGRCCSLRHTVSKLAVGWIQFFNYVRVTLTGLQEHFAIVSRTAQNVSATICGGNSRTLKSNFEDVVSDILALSHLTVPRGEGNATVAVRRW